MMELKQKTLRLVLGDQLNEQHSWFQHHEDHVLYAMMECRSETDYARHHIQKILGFFAAMRQFAEALQNQGHQVIYLKLDDAQNLQQIDQNCLSLIAQHQIHHFEYQLPDEYRLDAQLSQMCTSLSISFRVYDTEHFYTERNELREFFKGKKSFLMENFYRYMRKKHKVLVNEHDEPLHGQWNFDKDNREKLPKSHKAIAPLCFSNDLSNIESMLITSKVQSIGRVDSKHFLWPINRAQALSLLDFFCSHCLSLFGTFQDAMAPGEWSLYHSRLSFAMNIKLISPKEVINKAIDAYHAAPDKIAYHQLEGFVRQIIGWREYMRGIYWHSMPQYATQNYLNHHAKLPDWYWNANTKMNCLKHAISQSLDYSYAHHIQRLMVTGNFALLAGVHPDEVDAWYLGIYIDAIEWVEMPNTRGMSQYADGGLVASKPYISSAAYLHKMSSYCEGCYYLHAKKTGEQACPFNSLYWHFLHQHEEKLSNNPRMGMMYKVWQKMDTKQKNGILEQAEYYLNHINSL